ncbi:MFS transporter [Nocardioides sp. DS6]|uniref:MFS transporter n=1 Tax=Nocardioides eburneus TaxID=3231482 RepID=A0ABV3T1C0_9ACTN
MANLSTTLPDERAPMSHREILQAMSGLMLAMFVAIMSSTIVSNALPRIVAELHGTQTGYTWVAASTLLTMTASTPIWGKLADLFSKKLLMQLALGIYVAASLVAGLSPSMGMLIGSRAVQGVGVGGVMAMVQIVMASIVSPRERGKYSGYIGATFALATVLGPLIGGVIVDSSVGWRGCFYVGAPIAVIAFLLLQRTLHVPTIKREVHIDYLGAFFIVAGVSVLLIWVSLAGQQFAWGSWQTGAMVVGGLVLLAIAIFVEATVAREPIIPLPLFKDRTVALSTTASIFIGFAMMGATYYTSEYFQQSRGLSPTKAGLMSIFMVGGLSFSSIVVGRMITKTGRWRKWLISGGVLVVVGLGLLGTIDGETGKLWIGLFMILLGMGLGATNQNLVLAVQNNAKQEAVGAATAVVSFFRSMGGAIGVSALGAVLNSQTTSGFLHHVDVLAAAKQLTPADQSALAKMASGGVPEVSTMPDHLRAAFESAFGAATGHLFLIAAPFALAALVCILFIKEQRLRTSLKDLSDERIDPEVAVELELGELSERVRS